MREEPVSTVEELATNADASLNETTLEPEAYVAVKHNVAELAPIFSAERAYFILGNYGQPEIRRLQLVKDRLNRRPGTYAFRMVDVPSEWTNTHLKFRLLADYADYIVGVSEHAQGGFLVEQGCFTAIEKYFVKTHVFKREYADLDPADIETGVDIQKPYSRLQTSVFEMLEAAGRLCRWTTEEDLVRCAEKLP